MIEVTLIYADGTQWFAGGFPDMDSANKWINEEKYRPYSKSDTEYQIVDKTPPKEEEVVP